MGFFINACFGLLHRDNIFSCVLIVNIHLQYSSCISIMQPSISSCRHVVCPTKQSHIKHDFWRGHISSSVSLIWHCELLGPEQGCLSLAQTCV